MLFQEAAKQWVEEYQADRAYTTVKRVREDLRVHVLPVFASKDVRDITHDDVQSFALAWLVKKNIVESNPATNITYRNIPKRERKKDIFEPKEVEELIKVARPKWMGDVILLAYRTGMRRGEIFGLRWDNVNFNKKKLVRLRKCRLYATR